MMMKSLLFGILCLLLAAVPVQSGPFLPSRATAARLPRGGGFFGESKAPPAAGFFDAIGSSLGEKARLVLVCGLLGLVFSFLTPRLFCDI